uniref:Uncharacterized protein n=1 Tax=Myotis myotis TaxID=51298 RepID=A0A7J7SRQ3_MYOMY|nr:hypothetical protein mMyoMyo1_009425 [Myotis myotis]
MPGSRDPAEQRASVLCCRTSHRCAHGHVRGAHCALGGPHPTATSAGPPQAEGPAAPQGMGVGVACEPAALTPAGGDRSPVEPVGPAAPRPPGRGNMTGRRDGKPPAARKAPERSPKARPHPTASPPGHFFFLLNIFLLISERKGEGEGERNIHDERESWIGCLLHAPHWGPSPQPGHVPPPPTLV